MKKRFASMLISPVELLMIVLSILLLFNLPNLLGCEPRNVEKTAGVIAIIPLKYTYKIALNGYNIKEWSTSKIIVKIDASVLEGEPKAKFTLQNGKVMNTYESITIRFNNKTEAQKALGTGLDNIKIDGNNNVAMNNSGNNSQCFIDVLCRE